MQGEDFDELVSFFDKMAQTKWLSAMHNSLINLSGDWAHKDVLDVGCGTGRLLLRGAEQANSLTGIDLSEGMIEASIALFNEKKYAEKSTFQTGDACHLPFENEQFSVALSTCVMFLLPKPEEGLKEIFRVTKTGGTLAFLNPSFFMSVENAEEYAQKNGLEGFEKETLLRWENV
jgi:ubiquinone/menaquinone biosynthesis C-methylase UbiE